MADLSVPTGPQVAVAAETTKTINLLLIARYALFRESISHLLSAEPDFTIAAQCSSVAEALESLKRFPVDILLLDLDAGGKTIEEFIQLASSSGLGYKFLLLAPESIGNYEAELIRAGVCGIFHKAESADSLRQAIRHVAAGHLWFRQAHLQSALTRPTPPSDELTQRQRLVLSLVFDGLKNREIGARIGISESAVKATVQELFSKFGVRSRSHLVRIASERRSTVLIHR